MNIWESTQIAIDGLISNKLRAALTMLGIVIGVAAVITMMGVGRGAQESIEKQIQANGSNLLYITPGSRTSIGSTITLTYDDAKAMLEPGAAPSVLGVSPELSSFSQVIYQTKNIHVQVSGLTPDALSINNMQLAQGDFIDNSHLQSRAMVTVLGANAAKDLFQGENPIGQTVRINKLQFRVVGVLAAKGGSGFGSADDRVYIPLTTAQQRLHGSSQYRGSYTVTQITAKVVNEAQTDAAMQQITGLLRQRHRVTEDDFTILSQKQLLETIEQTTGVFTIVLSAIAAISLLVGGIGIMNIMLVSVTERTREIGLRKAVGARKGDILTQFLVEASTLSMLGGFIGVGLSYGLSAIVGGARLGAIQFTPIIGSDSILLATVFSVAIGIFFGAYPANRAASLHPIEALRYE